MAPAVWGPSVWQFAAHGESPTDARNRVQKQALQDARAVLAAAAPHLMAQAWDECMASLVYEDGTKVEIIASTNPYRSQA